jgi:predicted MFS family arabinose efflux permease
MVAVTAGTRWASRAQFFSAGFIFATWGVHVPTVKAHYGIDEAQLGLAMLAAGAGAMFGLTSAGRWIGRNGPRRMAGICGCIYALLLAGLIAMPGYVALLGLLAAFGLVTSVFDVSINTEAAQLELHSGTPLMSGMHGMFSLGGMAGAASGSAALAAGLGAQAHLLVVAVVMVVVVAVASTRMLPKPATASGEADHGFLLPRGALAVLGVLAALGLIAEGAIYDWSVLYMQQEVGAPQQQAALAYASFSGAMAAARFGGDAMRARFQPTALLLGSGLLAAAAMTLVLLTDLPWLALIGFAGVGIGFANVVPILFSASAKVPGIEPARGIAAVSAVAYLGFMAGPAVIGLIARATSLTAALYVVVVFAVALAGSARYTASSEENR